jgi:uncharacterized lipoprotein YmbA
MLKTLAPKRFNPRVSARPLASVIAAAPALVLAFALLVLTGCASRAPNPTVYVLKSEPPVAVALKQRPPGN